MSKDDSRTVAAWMTRQPHTIGDDQNLAVARERMHHFDVRHLPVLHGGHLVGVVSSRDIAMVEALPGIDLTEVTVDEAMAEEPWTVTTDAALAQVAATMAERKIGTTIIVDGLDPDQVVGVFTTTDALRALAALASLGGPRVGDGDGPSTRQ
jgi:acetoin utilization protein AcuB